MAAPVTSEGSQFPRTTFLEPAICRPRQGAPPPPLSLRPIWRNEDPQEHIKALSVDLTPFENDSFEGRGYSSSFLRSSAGHHSNHQCLPPPLTEPSPPRPYLGFGSVSSYPEPHEYYPTPPGPQDSSGSGSPTFPLRPSDNWSVTRTPSLSGSQDSFWGTTHSALAELPELSHRRSYSTINSDVVSTPVRETGSQISPVSPDSPWDRQCIQVPSPHRDQHDPSPTPPAPTAPWISESGAGTPKTRHHIYAARLRTSQACEKCRIRKAKVCGILDRACCFLVSRNDCVV